MADDLVARLRDACESAPDAIIAVYLFGSIARGDARRASDLDVGVLSTDARPPDSSVLESLRDRLETVSRKTVDLVVLETAAPDLVHRVLRDGVVLLDRERARRIAFEVRSRNEYFDLEPVRRLYRAPRLQPR
jgi:predicted nucleotidyltransferase